MDFDPKAMHLDVASEDGDGDDPMEEDEQIPVLTKVHLRTWQKALLEVDKDIGSCWFFFPQLFNFSIGRFVLFESC